MSWTISAVPLPDGDRPEDFWIDDHGVSSAEPLPGAQRLPGRFVAPGLVDAHAHPSAVDSPAGPIARLPADTLAVLKGWASEGVWLVRDLGSPGGISLDLELTPDLPRMDAAGRFLAPAGQYFPGLLLDGVPTERLIESALAELARGAGWVKVIADFPLVTDGIAAGEAEPTYSIETITGLVDAVHLAGGRVAVHSTTSNVTELVRAGVDSIEHGTGLDQAALHLMAETGAAWTPTLCAVLGLGENAGESRRHRVAERRERFRELLPLAQRLGVPILTGTDVVGTLAREIRLLAQHGLDPAQALAAASTVAHRFLGGPAVGTRQPISLISYDDDPREDLAILSYPSAILVNGIRRR